MNSISLEQARAVLDAAFAGSARRGTRNLAAVVTDPGGHIRAAYRSDTWGSFGVDIALAKARTALGFGRATLDTSAVFKDNASATAAINGAVGGQFLPLGGGIVVTDAAGNILGAAACAGATPDVDHAIAVAAVTAAGLKTPS